MEYRVAIVLDAQGRAFVAEVNSATGALTNMRQATDQGASSVGRMAQQTANMQTRTRGLVSELRGAIGLISAVLGAAVAREVLQTGLAMDSLRTKIQGITGDSRQTANELAFLRDVTERLGISNLVAGETYASLLAAARGTPLAAYTQEIAESVLTAGRAYQLSGDQIRGALTAIEQMISKGTVSAEELRGQLGERLPGAFQIAARSMGVTTEELGKMLENGEVVASQFLPKFARELRNATQAGAELAASKPAAEFERMGNALRESADQLSDELLKSLAEGARELTASLKELNESGAPRALGEALGYIAANADTALVAISSLLGARGIAGLIAGLGSTSAATRNAIAGLVLLTSTSGATAGALAALRIGALALFSALGGWVTVAAAAATGIYLLASEETKAEAVTRSLAEAVRDASSAQGEARTKSIELARQRYEEALATQAALQAAVEYTAGYSALQSAFAGGTGVTPINPGAVRELREYREEFARVAAEYAELTGFADQVRDKVSEIIDPLRKVAQALGLIERAAEDVVDPVGEVSDEFKKAVETAEDYIEQLIQQREILGLSTDQLVLYRAELAAAKAPTEALAEEIRAQAEITAEAVRQHEAAEQTVKDHADAQKLLEESAERVNRASIDLFEFEREMAAQLGGPSAQAALDYRRALEAVLQIELALMEVGPLTEEQQRRLANLRSQIAEQYVRDQADIAASLDTTRQAAERTGESMADGFGNAAAAALFHSDEIDEIWKDLGDDLLASTEQYVAQIISEFFKLEVIKPLLDSIFGTSGYGGLVNGGSGIGSLIGSVGSFFGFGGAVDGAAGFIGPPSTLANAGVSTAATTGASTAGLNLGGSWAGIPVVGWIMAGMALNDSLFGGGWRPQGGSTTLPNGAVVRGGGDTQGRILDRLFDPLGLLGDRFASLLSGSAVFTRLFGYSTPRLEGGQTTLDFGNGGVTGSQSYETRQRAGTIRRLFGSDDRVRTHTFDLDGEALQYAQDLWAQIDLVMANAARQLASDVPERFAASMRIIQKFNKDGDVTATTFMVDVLGRSYEELSESDAIARLVAEATIATIDNALGGVATALGDPSVGQQAIEQGGIAGTRLGEDGTLRWLKGLEEGAEAAMGTVGEASAIAERWRNDAQTLLEGAQFLLAASTDMRAGMALLGEGSTLTEIADLTEELATTGEPLIDTYARMVVSTTLLDDALSLANVALDATREETVRFAVGITEAAGGIQRAQSLWASYFNNFYTDAERAALALERARASAASQFGDIGLDAADFSGDGGAADFRALFEEKLPTLSAEAVVEWLEAADALGIVLDLQGRYNELIGEQADTIEDLMGGIESRIARIEDDQPQSFSERYAAINAETERLVARAEELGASEEQIQRIRYLGQLQLNEVMDEHLAAVAAQREAMGEYRDFIGQFSTELRAATQTDFQNEIDQINAWTQAQIDRANELAIAAGLEGAAVEDLTTILEVSAQRTAAAMQRARSTIQDLSGQLYGTALSNIEQQIALYEQAGQTVGSYLDQQFGGIDQVAQANEDRYQREFQLIQRLREFAESLLLDGTLSPLDPQGRLSEAERQYQELLARAQAGDIDALAELEGAARAYLSEARSFWGSTDAYTAIFDGVLDALNGLQVQSEPGGGGGSTGGSGGGTFGPQGDVGSGVSGDLAALYAQRDQLLAQQEAAQRRQLVDQLISYLADLARASGQSVIELAAELGVPLNQLVADLGINLDELTVGTTQTLAGLASQLGIEVVDLARSLGVELGELADRQSLLNDALENTILGLPPESADALEPLFRALEEASDPKERELALRALVAEANEQPESIRRLLAPYLEGINLEPQANEQVAKLGSIDTSTATIADILTRYEIDQAGRALTTHGLLRDLIYALDGTPSYAVGTSYVPRDGLAMLHEGEAVLTRSQNQALRSGIGFAAVAAPNSDPVVQAIERLRQDSLAQGEQQGRGLERVADRLGTAIDRLDRIDSRVDSLALAISDGPRR